MDSKLDTVNSDVLHYNKTANEDVVEQSARMSSMILDLQEQWMSLLDQRITHVEKQVGFDSKFTDIGKIRSEANLGHPPEKNMIPKPDSSPNPLRRESEYDSKESTKLNRMSPGPEKTLRQVSAIYNEKTGARKDTPMEEAEVKDDIEESESYLRNVMDPAIKSKLLYNEVDICQGPLLSLMKEAIPANITKTWTGQRVFLGGSFAELVCHWDSLKDARSLRPDDSPQRRQARLDLGKVLEYVQGSKDLGSYFKTRETNLESKVIAYEFLWTLFPPGSEVVSKTFEDEWQILIVGGSFIDGARLTRISCWYHDHDGNNWIATEVEFDIEGFPDYKSIESLPCFPLLYYKNEKAQNLLRTDLIERGKTFELLCQTKPDTPQVLSYKGKVICSKKAPSYIPFNTVNERDFRNSRLRSQIDNNPVSINERIIIDPTSFLENGPSVFALGVRPTNIRSATMDEYSIPANPDDSQKRYMLAPPRVVGWSTRTKRWCQFAIDGIQRAPESKNPVVFDNELQLDGTIKKTIKALVQNHNTQNTGVETETPDLIEGKGRSVVILLHGPPGVGKTLTAEAITAATGRPLLPISVSDIGLDADKAELNFERYFSLATRWGGILLLDEADVFLESRIREGDLDRNALVSVLLRVLEYYQGIIMLTTNRIKSIDIAVQSRIHLAVRYDDLTEVQMCNILKTFLTKFNGDERDKKTIITNFNDYVEENSFKLNGREIRNIVFSARKIAQSDERESITWRDIRQVMKATREFQNQLKSFSERQRYEREAAKDGS